MWGRSQQNSVEIAGMGDNMWAIHFSKSITQLLNRFARKKFGGERNLFSSAAFVNAYD
jgi:hypothetical protein